MNKSFSWRAFISFGLFVSFIVLLLSGVILYIGPSGKGNSGVVWEIIGLTKQAWQKQHIIFGFAFSIFSVFHLSAMNWKSFFSYLKSKAGEGLSRPVELSAILVMALFFGIGTYVGIQPFSGVLDFGKNISKSWDGKTVQQPRGLQRSADLAR
jgi:hypothetical protein